MSEPGAVWVVDRVEDEIVVLVEDDTGAEAEVARARFSVPVREGDVLRVAAGPDDEPDWAAAEPDDALRRERLAKAREALEELRKRDPGGDVVL